ncbi:MAG: hypothetical protein QOJ84_3512 [Bradyrhizobium sp.]|nr:hypothetical protein [Bradyrhizobium sp.]
MAPSYRFFDSEAKADRLEYRFDHEAVIASRCRDFRVSSVWWRVRVTLPLEESFRIYGPGPLRRAVIQSAVVSDHLPKSESPDARKQRVRALRVRLPNGHFVRFHYPYWTKGELRRPVVILDVGILSLLPQELV